MKAKYQEAIDRRADIMLSLGQEDRVKLVDSMIKHCDYPHEKYCVAMLYIYGIRPAELMLLKKYDFKISDFTIQVRLPPVKRGEKRVIRLKIESTPFLNIVADHVNSSLPLLPPTWNDATNINGVFKKISRRRGKSRLSPYVFRKFRLSYLAIELDASSYDIRVWKGAKDDRSVAPYIRLKPVTKFEDKIR